MIQILKWTARVATMQQHRSRLTSVLCALVAMGCVRGEAAPRSVTSDAGMVVEDPTGVAGTVRTAAGDPVGGGVVEVVAAGATPYQVEAPIRANGTYLLVGLEAGTYDLRLQPSHQYSLGAEEPDRARVQLEPGDVAVRDFVVQPAEWYDDFQGYASDEDFRRRFARGRGPEGHPRGPLFMVVSRNEDNSVYRPTTASFGLDPSAGPDGKQTLKVTFQARDDAGRCGTTNAAVGVRWHAPLPQNDEWWLRFVSREGDAAAGQYWVNGHHACREFRSYKFILWHVPDMWGLAVEAEAFKRPGQADWFLSILPGVGRRVYPPNHRQGGADGLDTREWSGVWHTWHFHYDATRGTDAVVITVYRDGEEFIRIGPQPYRTRLPMPPGALHMLGLGANINAGPHQTQSRWFREAGVYRSRPDMRPGPLSEVRAGQ